jgi:hypothetical protein
MDGLKKPRQPGYYWCLVKAGSHVSTPGKWIVAEWDGVEWCISHLLTPRNDDFFEVISQDPIPPPK